jgi:hypothetical protein
MNWSNIKTLIYILICSLIPTNIKTKLHISFEFFMKSFPLPLIWKHKIQSSPSESNLKKKLCVNQYTTKFKWNHIDLKDLKKENLLFKVTFGIQICVGVALKGAKKKCSILTCDNQNMRIQKDKYEKVFSCLQPISTC